VLAIRVVPAPDRPDALALPVRPTGNADDGPATLVPTAAPLPDELTDEAAALLPAVEHTGAAGVTHLSVRPRHTPARLLLLGVGAGDEGAWRTAGAALARAATRSTSVTVAMPAGCAPEAVRGLAEGVWLASYRFRMKSVDEPPTLAEVLVAVDDPRRHRAALDAARVTAEATWFARDLTNTPSSVKNPAWFADQVVAAAAGHDGLTVTVRGPDRLAAEGFGGILAVGGGSAAEPRLVELSWRPADARRHVVLVGKGITFDTGGVSIKPREAMKLMRKDMGGAAAVVAATVGAAALRLPVRVTALAPLAENMLSGSAFRPGDVIRHYGGLTSETTNSDAEGRLVLADALAYAVAELAPDLLVDLATLTGANAVALGKRHGALYCDDDDLAAGFAAAATAAGERVWRMPLVADYVEHLGSDLADFHSSPAVGAGSVLAALYLREFTGGRRDRWLHVDMSAPSWADADSADLVRGATGWGARTLLRWLADQAG
jgi:leucyl aminopeptidase